MTRQSARHLTGSRSTTDDQRAAVRPQIQATADQMLERSETALRAGAKIVGWQEEAAFVLEEDRQQVLDQASALAKRYAAYIQVSLGVFTRTQAMPYLLDQSILLDSVGKIVWTYNKTYPVVPTESYVTPYGPGRLPFVDTPYGRKPPPSATTFIFRR
jgi:apolipoprotein N-acyltransferase